MGELRKHYFLERYVIIATDRAKRPHDFRKEPASKQVPVCHFCPGNEDLTPPEINRITLNTDVKGWEVRYFPNKFPAVAQDGNYGIRTDNSYYTFSNNFGFHEVVIETPKHEEEFSELSVPHIASVFKVFTERIELLSKLAGIKYVCVFKNHLPEAGTSIVHSHSQIIAYNIIPKTIQDEEDASAENCPYCEIIKSEINSFRRCYENNSFISFTPYASRFPMEAWILPKQHTVKMEELSDDQHMELADMMKRILMKLKELNAPYNFYIQYGIKNKHLHIEIIPRLTKWAGFEYSTGTVVNTMSPEDAAKFYRGE